MPPDVVHISEGTRTQDNGFHDESSDNKKYLNIDDVLSGKVSLEDAYQQLEADRKELQRRKEEMERQAGRIVQQSTEIKDDPEDEINPLKPLTGYLGKYRGKWQYVEFIQDQTLEDIAHRYGAGEFGLRIGSMTGRMRRISISRELVNRVRTERDDPDDIYDATAFSDDAQPTLITTQPKDEMSGLLKELLLKQMDIKATTGSSVSPQDMQKTFQEGYALAEGKMQVIIIDKDRQITDLKKKIVELEGMLADYRRELGELPGTDDDDDNTATEPVPLPEKTFFEKAGEVFLNGLQQTAQNQQTAVQPQRLEHKPEKQFVNTESLIKEIILKSFKKNEVTNAVLAIKDVMTPFMKTAIAMQSKEDIIKYLVDNYLPNADEPLRAHIGKLIDALKG